MAPSGPLGIGEFEVATYDSVVSGLRSGELPAEGGVSHGLPQQEKGSGRCWYTFREGYGDGLSCSPKWGDSSTQIFLPCRGLGPIVFRAGTEGDMLLRGILLGEAVKGSECSWWLWV